MDYKTFSEEAQKRAPKDPHISQGMKSEYIRGFMDGGQFTYNLRPIITREDIRARICRGLSETTSKRDGESAKRRLHSLREVAKEFNLITPEENRQILERINHLDQTRVRVLRGKFQDCIGTVAFYDNRKFPHPFQDIMRHEKETKDPNLAQVTLDFNYLPITRNPLEMSFPLDDLDVMDECNYKQAHFEIENRIREEQELESRSRTLKRWEEIE